MVTAQRGGDSVATLLEWTFGAGHQAYTPVAILDGRFIEHRVSWYREANALRLTPGHSAAPSPDAHSALGIPQSIENARRCFGCHATVVGPELDLAAIQPGVTCERCHGPGIVHIAAARAGRALKNTILQPRTLNPSARVQVCAQCHRSPNREYQSQMPELDDPASIRFAPVGFQASACYQFGRSFSCTTCHNPHEDAQPASGASYRKVCISCHASPSVRGADCRQNCISCHMKKSSPLPNLTFTDHRIRVYPDEFP